jgi:selenocysteine-specific translation elongation factor
MGQAVTVALLGANDEQARSFGKKGTQSDVTLYNAVRDGHAATVVVPSQFPEKLPPLLVAIAMADRALLLVNALDRPLAETLATLDLFGPPVTIALGPSIGEEEFRRIVKGTRLEGEATRPLDLPQLRSELDGWSAPFRPGPVRVRLDHAFPVKGVGTVALGLVTQGRLAAHDRLQLYPTERMVEVRSIQVHDANVESADCGERVGVALKDVELDAVARGQVLAAPGSLRASADVSGASPRRSRYYKGSSTTGSSVQLLVGIQLVPAKVTEWSPNSLRLAPDRPVAFAPGDPLVVADLSAAQGPRVVASAVAT